MHKYSYTPKEFKVIDASIISIVNFEVLIHKDKKGSFKNLLVCDPITRGIVISIRLH